MLNYLSVFKVKALASNCLTSLTKGESLVRLNGRLYLYVSEAPVLCVLVGG
jgi:hypothetical protein